MEPIREKIEDLIWRHGVSRVVTAAVLLVFLLALRRLRLLRKPGVVGVVVVPAAIGAILVVGVWLSLGSLTIPRFSTEGTVVRNGVAVVVACGEKHGLKGMDAAMDHVPEPRTGTWWPEKKGECTVWYHRPPDASQRHARHERAQREQTSVENGVVRACGREFVTPVAEDRVLVEGMRKDCGIYPPVGDGTLAAYDGGD